MKIKLLLCLLLGSFFANAQVNVSESFETEFPAGWTVESEAQNFGRGNNATYACDGTWLMGTTLHSGNNHAMIKTSAYTSDGNQIVASFQSNRGVGLINGNVYFYYEVNNSGTWVQIASTAISLSCNTVSAVITKGVVPAGSTVKFRMQINRTSGTSAPVYIDNFKAIQQPFESVYNFDNSYNDTLGTNPFSAANTSFVADRFGNANSALKITGSAGSTANIPPIPKGNTPRTISIWYKTSANNNTSVFSYGTNGTNQIFGLYLGADGNPNFQCFVNDKNFGGTYSDKIWQHAVITFNGGTVKMYMNGDSIGNQAYTLNTGISNFKLGGGTEFVVDDLKMYDRALTAAEVAALYTPGPPPPPPIPIATYYFNNTYSDTAGVNPFSGANTVFASDRFGNANSAINITNSGAVATIPNLPYGNSARTVSLWVKLNIMIADYNFLYNYGNGVSSEGAFIKSTSAIHFAPSHTKAASHSINVWYHYVFTYDGTASKIYRDGVLLSTVNVARNTINNFNRFRLGLSETGAINYFNGVIDDLKIYDYALSDAEVAALYTQENLPVELSSFTAQLKNRTTNLLWSSATEINTSHFDIEYSNNGSEFTKVGSVQAQGNSNTAKQYSYQHTINEQPIHFYRLKMVDKDGKFAYSNIVRLKVAIKSFEASVYPTVVTNAATLSITSKEKGNAAITVTSMDGKRILQKNIVLIEGSQTIPLHLENLTKGSYIVSISVNGNIESYTIIKQ